jgi:hypothetical protein
MRAPRCADSSPSVNQIVKAFGWRKRRGGRASRKTRCHAMRFDPCQPQIRIARKIVRGGSHLCAPNISTGVLAMEISRSMLAGVSLLALSCVSALAQQVTGVPGTPSATATIDGKQIPPPDPTFGGVIKEKASESTAWWAPRIVPPRGAPNVLLIMTDDVGYSAPSTFGGVIPTPALDRIAAQGCATPISTQPRSAHRRGRR